MSIAPDSFNSAIYLSDFDRLEFLYTFLRFGIVLIINTAIAYVILRDIQFKLRLIPAQIVHVSRRFGMTALDDPITYERSAPYITAAMALLIFTPLVWAVAWGADVYYNVDYLLGITIFLLLFGALLFAFAVLHWRQNGWRINRVLRHSLFLCFIVVYFWVIWVLYLQRPFMYIAVSITYVSLSATPMTFLIYMFALSWTKSVLEYEGITDDLQADKQRLRNESLSASLMERVNGTPTTRDDEKKQIDITQRPATLGNTPVQANTTVINGNHHVVPATTTSRSSAFDLGSTDYIERILYGGKYMKVFVYFITFCILIAYGIAGELANGSDDSTNVAFITAGVVFVLDLTIFLCIYAGRMSSPGWTSLYAFIGRCLVVGFGLDYFFIGHCFMYVAVSVFFGWTIVDHWIPLESKSKMMATHIKQLIDEQNPQTAATDNVVAETPLTVITRSDEEIEAVTAASNRVMSSQLKYNGYMKHGKFAATPLGHFLIKKMELCAFSIWTIAFLIDLLIAYKYNHITITLQETHDQWEAGVVAIFVVLILISAIILYRLYRNNQYRVSYSLLGWLAIQYAVIISGGGFLYDVTKSVLILTFCFFMPLIVYLLTWAYVSWANNDFHWIMEFNTDEQALTVRQDAPNVTTTLVSSSSTTSQVGNTAPLSSPSVIRRQPSTILPRRKHIPSASEIFMRDLAIRYHLNYVIETLFKARIPLILGLACILTIGMGITIGLHNDPDSVGYSITAVIIIIIGTIISPIEYFNTFEYTFTMKYIQFITFLIFISYIITMWIDGLHQSTSPASASLLCLFFIYPISILFIFALYKWRDNQYKMEYKIKIALIICIILFIIFFILITILYKPFEIGLTLLILFLCFILFIFLYPILQHYFPRLIKYIPLLIISILIIFSAIISSQPHQGFLGFSMSWAILIIILGILAIRLHIQSYNNKTHLSYLFAATILPVYEFDNTHLSHNPIRANNHRVYTVIGLLLALMFWGFMAVFFLSPVWIGMAAVVVAMQLIIIYVLNAMTMPRLLLANAVRYLGEGSPLYREQLDKAKLVAIKAQLKSSKTIAVAHSQHDGSGLIVAGASNKASLGEAVYDLGFDSDDTCLLSDDDRRILGLTDVERRSAVNELDWQLYRFQFFLVYQQIPSMALGVCMSNSLIAPEIHVGNTTISRQRAYDMLLALHQETALRYHLQMKYLVHLQMELILGVYALQAEHEHQMVTMLRETTNGPVTIAQLRALPVEQQVMLERSLAKWMAVRKLTREKNRERRDEEIQEAQRREEERRRLDEEARVRQNVAIHNRAMNNDPAEIERRRLERERALIAERDRQRHAQDAEANALLHEQVEQSIERCQCTFSVTNAKFVVQRHYTCWTCKMVDGYGMCAVCKDVCHRGHDIRDANSGQPGPFYCGCGERGCDGMLTPAQRSSKIFSLISSSSAARAQVDAIIAECKRSQQKFVDRDFPPTQTSLCTDPSRFKHPAWLHYHWRRPENIVGVTAPDVFKEPLNEFHVKQGDIGDCYLLSAMTVLTQRENDFKKLFVTTKHTEHGVYSVSMYHNNQPVTVIIDSFFPVNHDGTFAFAKSTDINELWVSIVVKAYAKLYGSYEILESGFVDSALVDLSNGIGDSYNLTKDVTKQLARNGKLFNLLLTWRSAGYLLGAGSPAGADREENATPSGIVQGHAYAILDVRSVDDLQLIRLRNPWGRKEWTGDYSDNSDKWTRRLQYKLKYVNADDGAFWMSFADFIVQFEDIYVCRFFDPVNGWVEQPKINGSWTDQPNGTIPANAGGCTNYPSVCHNPQFLLTVQSATTVVLTLAQEDTRGTNQKLKAISVEIYNIRGRRVTTNRCAPMVAANREGYVIKREVCVEADLQPTDDGTPYTVLISTFEPNVKASYSLRVFSTNPIIWEPLPLSQT